MKKKIKGHDKVNFYIFVIEGIFGFNFAPKVDKYTPKKCIKKK